FVKTVCGGHGICGKCILSIDGTPQLACQTPAEDGMFVIAEDIGELATSTDKPAYGLAVNLNIATISIALVDLATGSVFSYDLANKNRLSYAEIINEKKTLEPNDLATLTSSTIDDICKGIFHVCREGLVPAEIVRTMILSGNTTIIQIVMGIYKQPQTSFLPKFIDMQTQRFGEIFRKELLSCDVIILPQISAYLSTDITAKSNAKVERDFSILINLGANGEVALLSSEAIIGVSTAISPAFEASNLSHGTMGIAGAITKVSYDSKEKSFHCKTIKGEDPIGICGAGAVDILSELLKNGLINHAGILAHDIEIAEGIMFTKDDVWQLQQAKSSVRAAIEILLLENNLNYDKIDNVYLVGNLGDKLNIDSAVTIGLLPKEWLDKAIITLLNSLEGSINILQNPKNLYKIINITQKAQELNLTDHPKFEYLSSKFMNFGESAT
ncbi:MAG: ASKHA domain-containing protein, partial [Defluviitaleaceae bacterium]|nr:ASKHA domain-containing protein [Defluviitaleaceae bacterium]